MVDLEPKGVSPCVQLSFRDEGRETHTVDRILNKSAQKIGQRGYLSQRD